MLEDTQVELDIEQLRPGLAVVRMPLPVRLDPINCYVGTRDDGKLIVIDAGVALAAEELWRYALGELGAAPEDVAEIFITHFHPDHIGGVGPLARITGARVLASTTTVAQSPGVWGEEQRPHAFARIDRHVLDHGFPQDVLDQLSFELDLAGVGVQLAADGMHGVADGESLRFAGADWELIPTPGHADGHACLLDRASGTLIAGDHVLERISPAVGLFPDYHQDPLGLYLDSLELVAGLDVHLVLPGHGLPFTGASERCRALRTHHEQRVEACLAPLSAGPRIAWEVACEVFGTAHDPANQRFALTETLAHLEYACVRGRAAREPAEASGRARWQYRAAG